MKTAVSIPDHVFSEAEQLARRLGISRSRLYARALDEFVSHHAPDRLTEAMNAAVDAASTPDDGFRKEAARRIFRKSEW